MSRKDRHTRQKIDFGVTGEAQDYHVIMQYGPDTKEDQHVCSTLASTLRRNKMTNRGKGVSWIVVNTLVYIENAYAGSFTDHR